MLTVTFLNFELGFDSGHQTLVGYAGQHYGGPSKFSHKESCQEIVCAFPDKAAFKEAMKQLARNYGLYGKRWVPVEILDDLVVPVVPQETRLDAVTLKALPDDLMLGEVDRRWPGLVVAPKPKPPVAERMAALRALKAQKREKELATAGAS